MYNFVPTNFKECDLDLKITYIQIDLTSCTPNIGYTNVHADMTCKRPLYFLICS